MKLTAIIRNKKWSKSFQCKKKNILKKINKFDNIAQIKKKFK